MIRCPNCGSEAPRETFEAEFDVLGLFMNQPVVKCRNCGALLKETGTFRKKWTQFPEEMTSRVEKGLADARQRFESGGDA